MILLRRPRIEPLLQLPRLLLADGVAPPSTVGGHRRLDGRLALPWLFVAHTLTPIVVCSNTPLAYLRSRLQRGRRSCPEIWSPIITVRALACRIMEIRDATNRP